MALKEVPDLCALADEIEANGMVEAASKVRAVEDYIRLLEKQLDLLFEAVAKQTGK